jgi:hypothetical protein
VVDGSNGTSCHFTYRGADPEDDLLQGDLLDKTPELSEQLARIHPHYNEKTDYTHFLVLTQSCDLVRRDGREGRTCKAKYISIAAVRPLVVTLEREIARYQDEFTRPAGVCDSKSRQRVYEFLERLLNNNEGEYFYLEPEPAMGLVQASCAFLRLSVAFRAEEHYERLHAARRLSLDEVFQAKLGWLVGNMYSRVGTDDWVPDHATREAFRGKIDTLLNEAVTWVDTEKLRLVKKQIATDASPEEFRRQLNSIDVQSRRDRAIEAVIVVLKKQQLVPDEGVEKTLRLRLKNDPDFAALFK